MERMGKKDGRWGGKGEAKEDRAEEERKQEMKSPGKDTKQPTCCPGNGHAPKFQRQVVFYFGLCV